MFNRKNIKFYMATFIAVLMAVAMTYQQGFAGDIKGKGFVGCDHGKNLLKSIETGTATAEDFILAVKDSRYSIEDISPSSVANYMEALANEGLLVLIPSHYFDDEEIMVALEVVFEDRNNILANWTVFENQWLTSKM